MFQFARCFSAEIVSTFSCKFRKQDSIGQPSSPVGMVTWEYSITHPQPCDVLLSGKSAVGPQGFADQLCKARGKVPFA